MLEAIINLRPKAQKHHHLTISSFNHLTRDCDMLIKSIFQKSVPHKTLSSHVRKIDLSIPKARINLGLKTQKH